MESLMPYLIPALIFMLFAVAIIRWVFQIDTQMQNQKKMIDLLGHILLRNGMTEEELKNVLNPKTNFFGGKKGSAK